MSRVHYALKAKNSTCVIEHLGCDVGVLRVHLEALFVDGMSWDNYGEWEIDHITPIMFRGAAGGRPSLDEVAARLHFTNTQPMWRDDNTHKGNRWIGGRSPPGGWVAWRRSLIGWMPPVDVFAGLDVYVVPADLVEGPAPLEGDGAEALGLVDVALPESLVRASRGSSRRGSSCADASGPARESACVAAAARVMLAAPSDFAPEVALPVLQSFSWSAVDVADVGAVLRGGAGESGDLVCEFGGLDGIGGGGGAGGGAGGGLVLGDVSVSVGGWRGPSVGASA